MLRTYPVKTVPHATYPVSLQKAREWLRVDIGGYTGEDGTIQDLLDSAIDYIETECNISLGVSDFEWYTESRPCAIPDAFYQKSITSIEHWVDGVATVIPGLNYELIRTGPRRSVIKWSSSFNTYSDRYLIKFKAGFAEGEVPPRLLMAIRSLVGLWYEDRGDSVFEKKTLSDKILAPFVLLYAG